MDILNRDEKSAEVLKSMHWNRHEISIEYRIARTDRSLIRYVGRPQSSAREFPSGATCGPLSTPRRTVLKESQLRIQTPAEVFARTVYRGYRIYWHGAGITVRPDNSHSSTPKMAIPKKIPTVSRQQNRARDKERTAKQWRHEGLQSKFRRMRVEEAVDRWRMVE